MIWGYARSIRDTVEESRTSEDHGGGDTGLGREDRVSTKNP